MRIVTRSVWGARAPRSTHVIDLPTPRLWIHHTAGSERGAEGMRSIQRYHMDTKGWNDIAYSFVVDRDGTIYEGRGVAIAGGHTEGDNSRSHAICAMGNYDVDRPTDELLASIVALARHGKDEEWWVPTCRGHREAPGASTACPGQYLFAALPAIRAAVNSSQPQEADDMTEAESKLLTRINVSLGALREHEKAHFDDVQARLKRIEATLNLDPEE